MATKMEKDTQVNNAKKNTEEVRNFLNSQIPTDNKNMNDFLKNLDYFISEEKSHFNPTLRTLDYYVQSWINGATSDVEYEKGVQTIEYFKLMLENKISNLNETEVRLFGHLCSLQVLYIALKPCYEKTESFLVKKLLSKIEEIRYGIRNLITGI